MKDFLEKINDIKLFVIDFSAIANIKDRSVLDYITDCILRSDIEVAVSKEFYENYDAIIMSTNNEQRNIAESAYQFLAKLNRNNCLLFMSDIINSADIIKKLKNNDSVCLVYYKNSEFSDNIKSNIRCKALIIDENGDFTYCDNYDEIVKASQKAIDESAMEDDFFEIQYIPNENCIVKTKNGMKILLESKLGVGGEGTVYNCSYSDEHVIKIYNKGQLNRLRLKKLFFMEKKQIRYNGICWPENVVYSQKGEPVGYLMKKAKGKALSSVFDGSESVLEAFPLWKKEDLVNLSIKILQKIQYLHLFGILLGDLRLKNIVIDEDGNPYLVDIDSCQIDNLPCPIGFPDYTPPELQKVEFKKNLRNYYNENFSCSVVLFKLLFCGIHPYDRRCGADTIEEEIRLKSFPYPQSITGDYSQIPWGDYDEMWKNTPYQMQLMFYNIFKNEQRCNLTEMILMLKTYAKFINLNKHKKPEINQIAFDYHD